MMNLPEYTCKLDDANIQMLNREARRLRTNSIKTSQYKRNFKQNTTIIR